MSAPETPPGRGATPQRRSGSERRAKPDRVVTMAPSPWRRRKRVRPWVLLSNTTNVLMILGFAGLVAFACWEAQSRQSAGRKSASHARVRPGSSATPLPQAAESRP